MSRIIPTLPRELIQLVLEALVPCPQPWDPTQCSTPNSSGDELVFDSVFLLLQACPQTEDDVRPVRPERLYAAEQQAPYLRLSKCAVDLLRASQVSRDFRKASRAIPWAVEISVPHTPDRGLAALIGTARRITRSQTAAQRGLATGAPEPRWTEALGIVTAFLQDRPIRLRLEFPVEFAFDGTLTSSHAVAPPHLAAVAAFLRSCRDDLLELDAIGLDQLDPQGLPLHQWRNLTSLTLMSEEGHGLGPPWQALPPALVELNLLGPVLPGGLAGEGGKAPLLRLSRLQGLALSSCASPPPCVEGPWLPSSVTRLSLEGFHVQGPLCCPPLRRLELADCHFSGSEAVLSMCPRLTFLAFSEQCNIPCSCSEKLRALQPLASLQDLSVKACLAGCDLGAFLVALKGVHHLSLCLPPRAYRDFSTAAQFPLQDWKLLASLKNLTDLHLELSQLALHDPHNELHEILNAVSADLALRGGSCTFCDLATLPDPFREDSGSSDEDSDDW